MGGSDARDLVKVKMGPIKYFVHWFQTISANLDTEVQKRALSALRETASPVLTNEWYNEGKSNVVKAAPFKVTSEGSKTLPKWQRSAFLIKVEIEAQPKTLLEGDNIN